MKNEYVVNKSELGLIFTLTNPHLPYNSDPLGLNLDYKIDGKNAALVNNKTGKTTFNPNEKVLSFSSCFNENRQIIGINVPSDMIDELCNIYADLTAERNQLINKVIQKIIDGEVLINFNYISGNMDTHYHASIKIEEPFNSFEFRLYILSKAIKIFTTNNSLGDSPYEFLENKLGYDIFKKGGNINPKSRNIKLDDSGTIIAFDMTLEDIIYDLEDIKEAVKSQKIKLEEREALRKSLILKVISKGKDRDGKGADYYVKVELEDPNSHEKLKFVCRNIFDFGYVINPDYSISEGIEGGHCKNGMWQDFCLGEGWKNIRPLTKFEEKCLDYLYKFPPLNENIRL